MATFAPLPPPFDRAQPTLVDPSGTFRVWLTDPPGLIDQASDGAKFTTELALWLTQVASDAMLATGTPSTRFLFLHDWRAVSGYTTDARLEMIKWGRTLGPQRIDRIEIVMAPDAGTLMRMAVQGGAMAMTVLGVRCALADGIEAALAATQQRPRAR